MSGETTATGAPADTNTLPAPAAANPGNNDGDPTTTPPAEPTTLVGETVKEGDPADPAPKEGDGDPKEAPAGAPEAYGDFTMPEGVKLAEDALSAVTQTVRDLDLTQEQAQKVVDLMTSREAAEQQAMDALVTENQKAITDRPRFAEEKAAVAAALTQMGTPELRQKFTDNPVLGNDPDVWAFLANLGARFREPGMNENAERSEPRKRDADVFFGDSE